MKFNLEIVIEKPIAEVIEKFDSSENLKHWQPGFISMDHFEGVPGEVGAKSKLKYKMGKREVEMVETITVKNLPAEFSGTYVTGKMWNEIKNYFESTSDGNTRYKSQHTFKIQGFLKLVGWIMPGAFKKESMKYLTHFKNYVETGASVEENH
ncbi:MAG: hypothetical protein ACI837_002972 [Crocinitomicaceae bacterium]|jgi:hypothetical protein